jgi:hypothetical protein
MPRDVRSKAIYAACFLEQPDRAPSNFAGRRKFLRPLSTLRQALPLRVDIADSRSSECGQQVAFGNRVGRSRFQYNRSFACEAIISEHKRDGANTSLVSRHTRKCQPEIYVIAQINGANIFILYFFDNNDYTSYRPI